jgi:DNA invertase Pin-like site-specific DNA recombinase
MCPNRRCLLAQTSLFALWRAFNFETIHVPLTMSLDQRGIGFRSIAEAIDTTTSGGKLVFHIFGALAEFERDIIRERTQAGLQAARARGRRGGRPQRQPSSRKVAMARALYADKTNSVQEICKDLGISRATLYRYLNRK